MLIDHAGQIFARLGPVTVAVAADLDPTLASALALAGCRVIAGEDATATCVGLARWSDDGDAGLAGLIERAGGLAITSGAGERSAVDQRLLAAGWSRHPADLDGPGWAAATSASLPPLAFYRRDTRPASDLLARGDAQADMSLTLFARAAERVRPGDDVLVLGAQATAAATVLEALSRARTVSVIAGAALLVGAPRHGAGVMLLIASTAESVDDALLAAVAGALRPDGRLLIVWPADEDGVAPLRDRVDERFISEGWMVQRSGAAGGPGVTLHGWTDTLPGDQAMLVASANPLLELEGPPPFTHPAFSSSSSAGGMTVADFAGAYANPWLYRVMVQIGERLGDEIKLARLAECVLDTAAAGTADRGAAITVLGYRVLDRRLVDAAPAMLALIEAFLSETGGAAAPHLLRWRLSLLFLAGRLCELAGDPDTALVWYDRAATADWQGFSPLIATKAIAARYHAARLLIAAGEGAAAIDQFRRGMATALAAAAAPHDRLIGDPDRPLPFYLTELAEVIDMGAQCANAVAAAPLLARDAGLFWRQVDVKRFGLFAWADALARENMRLREG